MQLDLGDNELNAVLLALQAHQALIAGTMQLVTAQVTKQIQEQAAAREQERARAQDSAAARQERFDAALGVASGSASMGEVGTTAG